MGSIAGDLHNFDLDDVIRKPSITGELKQKNSHQETQRSSQGNIFQQVLNYKHPKIKSSHTVVHETWN